MEHARWGGKITIASLPAMTIVDDNPQRKSAELAIKKIGRGDASKLELLNATHAHTTFQSTVHKMTTGDAIYLGFRIKRS